MTKDQWDAEYDRALKVLASTGEWTAQHVQQLATNYVTTNYGKRPADPPPGFFVGGIKFTPTDIGSVYLSAGPHVIEELDEGTYSWTTEQVKMAYTYFLRLKEHIDQHSTV